MKNTLIIIIILCIIFLSNAHKKLYEFMTTDEVLSDNDKRVYRISSAFNNTNMAADKLSELNKFIIDFLRFVKNKYVTNDYGERYQKDFYKRMISNYNMDVIFENNPSPGEETSFVSDKGSEFGICLRDKGNNSDKFHENNILQFVMLHELTHLGCLNYGHGKEFWSMFKIVLNDAVESDLYTPVDYSKKPVNYCGLPVYYNPYFKI